MELAIDDPIKRAQEYAVNPNNYQGGQAPLSNNPGLGTQMANMAKQQLMEKAVTQGTSALTGAGTTAGMGGSAMAGIGTAMPYVGAGLLAGKALGFFNEGGTVGPLSTQYAASGDRVYGMGYSIPNPFVTEAELLKEYDKMKNYPGVKGESAAGNFTYEDFKHQRGLRFNQGGKVDPINQILDEIEAESMVEGAIGVSQEMPMPMMRPPLGIDAYGADTTSSPYDMIRPDNAPNT